MKYFPLVWSALRRNPSRAVLSLLAIIAGFTLFGLTTGIGVTFAAIAESANADRIFVDPRFGGLLPMAIESKIAALPGVTQVGAVGTIAGYHQEAKNHVFVMMADSNMRSVRSDWPLSSRQWDAIANDRTGLVVSKTAAIRWHLKPGDSFAVVAPSIVKADGTKSWIFNVLDIVNDVPAWVDGYMIGNVDYLDKARPLADQGLISWFEVLAANPTLTPKVAEEIVRAFANSATPLQTTTEASQYSANNSGIDMMTATRNIALAGLGMILFLIGNVVAQSVRERFAELATLKTIGFSGFSILLLIVLEAAIPCVIGAGIGVGAAAGLADLISRIFPPSFGLPVPSVTPAVFLWAAVGAVAIALFSATVPALRLKNLEIAAVLSGR